MDFDRLCRAIVPEKHPEKNQRNEREISESYAAEEEDES